MSHELTTQTDAPRSPVAQNAGERPLIHDLMPPAGTGSMTDRTFGADRAMVTPASAGNRALEGGFLNVPPLDYGAGIKSMSADSSAIARPVQTSDKTKPVETAQADPFKTTGDKLTQTASDLVGHNLTVAPKGSKFHGVDIPERYGCAASLSNVMIKDGSATPKQFNLSVDGFENMLISEKGATRVPASQLQKGDFVVGREERDGSGGRHVGIVDVDKQGHLIAYNNANGRFKASDLQKRFLDKYDVVYGLRLPKN